MYRYLIATLLCLAGTAFAKAVDPADEARAINREVLALIQSHNWAAAEMQAKKGLLLCDGTGGVMVFCVSQFNESLGDIAFAVNDLAGALKYYETALSVREANLDSGHVLISRSRLRIGRTFLALNRLAEAETSVKLAISGFEKLEPNRSELRTALDYLRKIYVDTNRFGDAVAVARREFELSQKLSSGDAALLSSSRVNLGDALLKQARSLFDQNKDAAAEQVITEGIQLIDPPPKGGERILSSSLALLGAICDKQRRYAEAASSLLRARDYLTQFAAPSDPNLPVILFNLARVYQKMDKPTDSIPYEVLSISKFDENRTENSTLGYALFWLGKDQISVGKPAEAEQPLLRAVDVLDRVLPASDPQRVNVRLALGDLQLSEQKHAEAARLFNDALELLRKYPNPDTSWRSSALTSLGMLYRDEARFDDAERLLSEAIKLEEAVNHERQSFLPQRLTALATILRRENRYKDAEAALSRALTLEQPELDRATTLNALGVVYTSTERHELAEPVLNEALAIRKQRLPSNSALILETSLSLATIDRSRGHFAEAEAKLRGTLKIAETLGSSSSSTIALHSEFLAEVLASEGKLDEAAALIERSVKLYQQLGTDDPRLASALKVMASIEAIGGHDREAEQHDRQALSIDERVIGPESPAVASDLISLVPVLERAGRFPDAKSNIDRALTIAIAHFGPDNPMTTSAILASANMAYRKGQYSDARKLADRARQIQERALGLENYALVGSWIFATQLDLAEGKLDDASADIDHAADIVAKALPAEHPSYISVLSTRADIARARGGLADAERLDRDAFSLAQKHYEPDHPVVLDAVDRLTSVLWAQGKFSEAERVSRDELSAIELKRGPDYETIAAGVRRLATILGSSARQPEAIALYRRALTVDEQAYGPQGDRAASDHLAIGSMFRVSGQFDDARKEINLARTAWQSQGHLLAANSALEQLAYLALDIATPTESVIYFEQMLSVAEQALGPDSPALAPILAQLGRLYLVADRDDAAERVLSRATGLIGPNPPEQTPGLLIVLQLKAQLDARHGDFAGAETQLFRTISMAGKYAGVQSSAVASNVFNLAIVYLNDGRFQDAIKNFAEALEIFKRESGERAPVVGYILLGAAQAYAKAGDDSTSKALFATAIEILGPAIAAQSHQPRWL